MVDAFKTLLAGHPEADLIGISGTGLKRGCFLKPL